MSKLLDKPITNTNIKNVLTDKGIDNPTNKDLVKDGLMNQAIRGKQGSVEAAKLLIEMDCEDVHDIDYESIIGKRPVFNDNWIDPNRRGVSIDFYNIKDDNVKDYLEFKRLSEEWYKSRDRVTQKWYKNREKQLDQLGKKAFTDEDMDTAFKHLFVSTCNRIEEYQRDKLPIGDNDVEVLHNLLGYLK